MDELLCSDARLKRLITNAGGATLDHHWWENGVLHFSIKEVGEPTVSHEQSVQNLFRIGYAHGHNDAIVKVEKGHFVVYFPPRTTE